MTIIQDPTAILSIQFEGRPPITVGINNVKMIRAYEEAGEMAMVTWIEVSFERGNAQRYNLKYIQAVIY